MNNLGFTFEDTPWEATLSTLRGGESFSALRFLTLLEGEEEEAVEDAFEDLNQRHILLDVDTLPYENSGAAAVRLRQEKALTEEDRLLPGLEKTDPLAIYLREISQIQPITQCDELARDAQSGNNRAMEQLTGGRLFRVIQLAKELTGHGVLLLDLIQEGSLGLCQGILSWNEGSFEDYTDWHIRSAMARCITLQARNNGIGQKMRSLLEDYRSTDRRLLTKLGRNPTMEEIALDMNLSPEDASVVEQMLLNARTMEKVKKVPDQMPQEEDQAVEDTAYFHSRQRIMEMLSTLDETEAKLLTLRFGLEGGLPLTPEQTGKQMNMTPDEVVRAEAAALAKLRSQE